MLNLGEDSIKFDFDKAELKPKERELLSRIAGILLTSSDYTVSVNGHTDDVGTEDYNQKLSERRAEVVHRYLIEAGVPERDHDRGRMGQSEASGRGNVRGGAGEEPASRARDREQPGELPLRGFRQPVEIAEQIRHTRIAALPGALRIAR